jgi:hypothetical protein
MQKGTVVVVIIFLLFSQYSFSQKVDSTKSISHFSGSVNITNNGISVVPTFSLGKPAVIINLSVGKTKLSFEPDIRFSLTGKPWSFLFWWRYKLVQNNKWRISTGAHPALNFRTETDSSNGVLKERIVARRYLAAELSPHYLISKNISVGMYYLYSHGIDAGTIKNTHFITINSNFSNIKLTKQFFMKFMPQLYYLKLDELDGFYYTATTTLAKKNCPLSLSGIINKTITSSIANNKNFVWNVSLVYSFNKKYIKL